jgi:hypothetical protein
MKCLQEPKKTTEINYFLSQILNQICDMANQTKPNQTKPPGNHRDDESWVFLPFTF